MTTRDKLAALRSLMKKHRLDAYYVPSVDPHQSEYVPACWRRRGWLSGFTGSAGDLLVTARMAALWTDGRYFLQAEDQLADSGIALMRMGDPGVPSLLGWAASRLKKGQVLGVDPRVMSMAGAESFAETLGDRGVKIRYVEQNLVDAIWTDRPEPSTAPLTTHPDSVAGETVAAKLARVRAELRDHGARALVLAALDQIAWLFNVRSQDIEHNPMAIAYAVVTERGATVFVDPRKVTAKVRAALKGKAMLRPYAETGDGLRALARKRVPVLLDPASINQWIVESLKGAPLLCGPSPVIAMRAVKNPVQIRGITACHVRDGAAMVRFLKWLETAVPAGGQTELSAAAKLRAFRAMGKRFRDTSFATISAYGPNGAIIHYEPTPETDAKLKPRGLYLIDSGGQYDDGTTDITRTVALGPVTAEMRRVYTLVLKANINLTRTPFPQGWAGGRIDALARQALWLTGYNYNHGTGHGVGQYLGVHEGPMSISFRDHDNVPLVPGQFLSIEPGYYAAGKFGVRLENLAFVASAPELGSDGGNWCRWDVVTLCPFDASLIDLKLLDAAELAWLNAYHKRVNAELAPLLDAEHRAWLKRATRKL